jgi:hypothetical protein
MNQYSNFSLPLTHYQWFITLSSKANFSSPLEFIVLVLTVTWIDADHTEQTDI